MIFYDAESNRIVLLEALDRSDNTAYLSVGIIGGWLPLEEISRLEFVGWL